MDSVLKNGASRLMPNSLFDIGLFALNLLNKAQAIKYKIKFDFILYHFFLLKIYAITSNPTNENIISNPEILLPE